MVYRSYQGGRYDEQKDGQKRGSARRSRHGQYKGGNASTAFHLPQTSRDHQLRPEEVEESEGWHDPDTAFNI